MQGKVALATGGSSGIGLATAGAFARQGVKVVIASRREATAKTALKQLSTLGDVQWLPADVADGKSAARLMDSIMNTHGRLDSTRSVPEAIEAYGECLSAQMKMTAEDGQHLFNDWQQVTQKVTKSLGNGNGWAGRAKAV
jgi:NAD(P)-dependent dehydrogenase (short-subunit alcohol dehydrogenase family)